MYTRVTAGDAWKQMQWIVLPVLLGVLYFLFQWTQLSMFGVTWDEPLHRNWGKIFAAYLETGDRRLLHLMPGNGVYYGPLYYYLNYELSEALFQSGFLRFFEANHVLNLMTASAVVAFTFCLGRAIGGRRAGFFAVMFLVFYPPFLAHSHYNPKDIPLMAGILLTAYTFLLALRRSSWKMLVLSGLFMGLSIALKVSALLMAPVFLAVYIVWIWTQSRTSSLRVTLSRRYRAALFAFLACIGGIILFWPSVWTEPSLLPKSVAFFLRSDFWPGRVLFFGTEYVGAELPWYYTSFEFAAGMPILMLLAFGAGTALTVMQIRRGERSYDGLLLLLWIFFPLFFTLKPGLVRYDGMRQFFFILPAAATVAAIGLERLLVLLSTKTKRRSAGTVFIILVLFSLMTQVLTIHPFEGSYRNEIVRLAYPESLDRAFQIEYWGASYKQGMDWLVRNAEENPIICVPTAGILVTWYPWRDDFVFECSKDTTYVMFFTRYSEAKQYDELRSPVHSIRRMHSDLLQIYHLQ